MRKQTILLASGGLDSSILAFYLKKKLRKRVKMIFFDYGQRALEEEILCARNLAKKLKSELKIVDLRWLGKISTSLINKRKNSKEEIIKWYVPFRNSLFLVSALAFAESEFIKNRIESDIFLGIKYEGEIRFKDTSKEFLIEINKLAEFSQKGRFKIMAPFINKDKEEIIELGKELGVGSDETYSCYLGGGFTKIKSKKIPVHCGKCAGCKARKKGFRFSNVKDSSLYED